MADSLLAAAEAALRYNVRTLAAACPGGLDRALVAIGGAGGLDGSARTAAGEGLAVEGLTAGQTQLLERWMRSEGGDIVTDPAGRRAVLVGSMATLATVTARLADLGPQTEGLAAALAAALGGGHARPPLRCGDHLLEFGGRTLVMGVVNVTPDSFSGDGVAGDPGSATAIAERMVADGADIVDVGGESSRPDSQPVDAATELRRVLPVIEALAGRLPVPISIDTRKAEVASAAIGAGATLVNDIWGLRGDGDMAPVLAAHPEVALVAMHNRRGHVYDDLGAEVARDLRESLLIATRHGIALDRVVIDPGFGFGKTPGQNLELVQRLTELRGIGRPLLLGPSRKSTIGLLLDGAPPHERVEGTLVLCVLASAAGADMVRVHDVAAIRRGLRVSDAVLRGIPEAVRAAEAPGPTG